MAFYTPTHLNLNLARTPDLFTNAFALQSCQAASASYPTANSSDTSSSALASPYSYKTSRARTQQAGNSATSSSSAAGPSIRGAADLLQNTFALASKPWRTLKQDAMLTPPMTSTFPPRTMAGACVSAMGYSSSSAGSGAYAGSGSGAAALPTPTSMAASLDSAGGDEAYQSQPHQEYHSYHAPPSQNQHQYRQEAASQQQQQRMTLPPIAHLDRHLSHLPPLTPPADLPLPHIQIAPPTQSALQAQVLQTVPPAQTRTQAPLNKASPQEYYSTNTTRTETTSSDIFVPPPPSQAMQHSDEQHKNQPQAVQPTVDWLDFTRTRSAHFIAEKTCEMICYLWFAMPSAGKAIQTPATPPSDPASISNGSGSDALFASPASLPSVAPSSGTLSKASPHSAPSTLQLRATPTFVSFMQKLLETTQVSQSVIVLSLHYIYRLKEKNQYTPAQPGSEFRIAVAGLMMGNKFLDDNTYTNKTWSEVSGIDLGEINHMEREFLLGVDFNLYVDKATYEAWLNLLKGLVLAKERDCRRFGSGSRSRRHERMEGRDREGRSDRDGRAERERERERERRKAHGGGGPAARTYTVGTAVPTIAAFRSHTHHRARSTSPTLRMSSSTSAVALGAASQTAAVYLPYPPGQQKMDSQPGYYPPSTASYAFAPQAQAPGQYASSTSTYAPVQTAVYQAPHQQYPQQPMQQPAPAPIPVPPYMYPTTTPYASYPSGTSSAYTSPSPAPASVAPVHHAPSTHAHPIVHISTAIPRSGSKRTAEAAFSPTSASFARDTSAPPAKTRSVRMGPGPGISLRIPDVVVSAQGGSAGAHTASPLEGLGSFERMSIGSRGASPTKEREEREERERERERESRRESVLPKTLSSKYSYSNDGRRSAGPQNLYFYTLACSPLKPEPASSSDGSCSQNRDSGDDDMQAGSAQPPKEDGAGYGYRKARLRYHQPVLPSNAPYSYADLNASRGVGVGVGVHVQNASALSYNPYAAPIPPLSGWPAQQQQQQQQHHQHLQPVNQHLHPGTRSAIQSAATSPAMLQPSQAHTSSGALPHFRDDVWARPPAPAYPAQSQVEEESSEGEQDEGEDSEMAYTGPAYTESPVALQSHSHSQAHPPFQASKMGGPTAMYAPRTPPHNYHQVQHAAHNAQYERASPSARVPSAPFANAGPPGVGVVFYEDSSPLRPLQCVASHASAAGAGAAVGGAVVSGGYAAYQPPAASGGYSGHSQGQQSYSYAYGNGYEYNYGR